MVFIVLSDKPGINKSDACPEDADMYGNKQLQFFVACVEEGSFSRAAEAQYTTQPNISRVIKLLEQELGIELFIRNAHGITPTTEGKALYQYACEIIQREQMIANLAVSKSENSLRLSFNQSRSIAKAVMDFNSVHNNRVRIQAFEKMTELVIQDVEQFRSDLGFVFVMDTQMAAFSYHLERRGLECETLFQMEASVSVGEKNPLYRKQYVSLKELHDIQYVQFDNDYFSLQNGACTVDPTLKPSFDNAFITNSSSIIVTMIESGDFCNLCIPSFYGVKPYGGIKAIPISPKLDVNVICVHRHEMTNETNAFLNYLKSMVAC